MGQQAGEGLQHEAPVLALGFEGTSALWSGDAAGRLLRWPIQGESLQPATLVSEGDPIAGLTVRDKAVWVLRPNRLECFSVPGGADVPQEDGPRSASGDEREAEQAIGAALQPKKASGKQRPSEAEPESGPSAQAAKKTTRKQRPSEAEPESGPSAQAAKKSSRKPRPLPAAPDPGQTLRAPKKSSKKSPSSQAPSSDPPAAPAGAGAGTGPESLPTSIELPEGLHRLACRGDKLVAAGDAQAVVLGWTGRTWGIQCTVDLPRGTTDDLDVSWDGLHFLVVKDRAKVEVFSTRDGKRAGGFVQKQIRDIGARFSQEPGWVYRGCRGSYDVKLVKWTSGRGNTRLRASSAWSCPVEISPDGSALAALITGNAVQVYDLGTHEASYFTEPIIDRSQDRLMAGLSKAPAAFRQLGPGIAKVSKWRQPPDADVLYSSLALAEQGKLVALGGVDGRLILISTTSCRVERTPAEELHPACCTVVRQGRIRAVGRQGSEVLALDPQGRLWSWPARKDLVQRLELEEFLPENYRLGKLFWDAEHLYLREGETLSAFSASSGQRLWHMDWKGQGISRSNDGRLWWTDQYIHLEENQGRLEAETQTCLDWIRMGSERITVFSFFIDDSTELASAPVPAGHNRMLLRWSEKGQGYGYRVLELDSHAHTNLGNALAVYPAQDGRHFALARNSWQDFEIWDGENPQTGPILIWRDQGFPFGAIGSVTFAPEAGLIVAGEAGHGLVVWDREGRVVTHFRGAGASINGLCVAADGSSVLTWEVCGNFRQWDLKLAPPAPPGDAEVLKAGEFQYVPVDEVHAAKEAVRRADDPAVAEIDARIDVLRSDRFALRRYAWGLPDEVPDAIDQRLRGLLGDWRPQVEVQEHKVNHWVRLARSQDAGERASAAWAFGFSGWEGLAGLDLLVELVRDPSWSVRNRAAQSLGYFGRFAAPAVEGLVELLADANDDTARSARSTLWQIGLPALQPLVRMLKHQKAEARQQAVDLLAGLGPAAASAVPDLIEAARDKRGHNFRRGACHALGRMGVSSPEVVKVLLERLQDKKAEVRHRALVSLAELKTKPETLVPAATQLLGDPDLYVRLMAAKVLRDFGPAARSAAPALEALLSHFTTRDYSEPAQALFEVGGEREQAVALQALQERLTQNSNEYRRTASASALESLGPRAAAAVPDLMAALKDPFVSVRTAALKALVAIGQTPTQFLPQILEVLRTDAMPEPRREAARLAAKLGLREAIPDLLDALRSSPFEDLRRTAAVALGQLGGPEVVEGLKSSLQESVPYVQIGLCESLVQLGQASDQVVDLLIKTLDKGGGAGAIREAAELLGKMGPQAQRAVPVLRQSLGKYYWREALQSLEALGEVV